MWRKVFSITYASRSLCCLQFRSFSRALPKHDTEVDSVDVPRNVRRRKVHRPTLYPQTSLPLDDSMVDEIFGTQDSKGAVNFDAERLDPKTRAAVSKAYSILTEDETTDEEQKDVDAILDVLKCHPNYDSMSPEQLLDVLNLYPETRKAVESELKRMVDEAEECLKDVDIRNIFPESQMAETEFVKGIETVIAKDPTLQKDVNEWIKKVKERVGNDLSRMEALSDEDFMNVATPPERLRKALRKVLPNSALNLDAEGDVVRFFSNKK